MVMLHKKFASRPQNFRRKGSQKKPVHPIQAAAKWRPHFSGGYHWRDHSGTPYGMENIPDGFIFTDAMNISDYPGFTLPQGIMVGQWALLSGSNITSIPDRMEVFGSFTMCDAPRLEQVGQEVRFHEHATLQNLPVLKHIGHNLSVKKWMAIRNCPQLERLPDNFYVGDHLLIQGCPKLRELPRGLKVGCIEIIDCPDIEMIPDDIEFVGTGRLHDKIRVKDCGNPCIDIPTTYFDRALVLAMSKRPSYELERSGPSAF